MITASTIESIADEELAAASLGGLVNIHSLAKHMKLEVRLGPAGMRATMLGRTIVVPSDDPPERRRFATAHEIAHRIFRERGLCETEPLCDALASALLHPRAWFQANLAARGLDLRGLRVDCSFSSHEAIARRAVSLGGCSLWICDRGPNKRLARRYCSSGTPQAIAKKPTAVEWALVRQAAVDMRDHHIDGVGSFVLPGRVLRVIALSRVDDLARLSG